MHISIAGKLGSGKSTICNILKQRHGFQIYSTGAIQRELAKKHNVSTLEMNRLMTHDVNFDFEIDNTVTEISTARCGETIIFDSRMAWKFAVNSFKVFVTVDPLAAAERVMNNPRGTEEVYTGLDDAKSKLIERGKIENERYKVIYNVDNFDYSNYNLVIDSTYTTPDDLADIIFSKFQGCGTHAKGNDILLSPKSLFPLNGAKNVCIEDLDGSVNNTESARAAVSVTALDGYHFIVDGHHGALYAIINNEKFICVRLADSKNYPLVKSAESIISEIQAAGFSSVRFFEETGGFKYKSYPSYYSV